MIQREVIPSLQALLKCLARFVEGHHEWSALVTGVNGLEESLSPLPAHDEHSGLELPPGEDQADRPVSALKRRWTLLSDAALDWTAGVLYKLHLRKWGSAVEDRCPAESVEFCSVCSARELVSLSLFCDEQTVCVTCIRRVLHRANRGRSRAEPQLTPVFLAELLGLHRVPDWRLDPERARERTEADVRARLVRLHEIAALELRVMHRWAVAIAPVAMVLQPMTRSLSALLSVGREGSSEAGRETGRDVSPVVVVDPYQCRTEDGEDTTAAETAGDAEERGVAEPMQKVARGEAIAPILGAAEPPHGTASRLAGTSAALAVHILGEASTRDLERAEGE